MSESINCKTEADFGAFIPSMLDDFGLNPFEFRVYAHISRRAGGGGKCWEGMQKIADLCKMNIKTVRRAIASLGACCLIRIEFNSGSTNHITLTHPREWRKPDTPTKSGRTPKPDTPTKNGGATPTKLGSTPLPDLVDEGTPIEIYPNEGTPTIPPISPTGDSEPIALDLGKAIDLKPEPIDESFTSVSPVQKPDRVKPKSANEDQLSAAPNKSRKEKITADFERFQQVWNDRKPAQFARLSVMNKGREKIVLELVKTYGNEDLAIQALEDALSYAAIEPWCEGKNLTFENFTSKNKVISWSEKWQNRPMKSAHEGSGMDLSFEFAQRAYTPNKASQKMRETYERRCAMWNIDPDTGEELEAIRKNF